MAVLSYAAQQMKGPVASFADVLTAVSQELGGAPRRKKGGLAGERLTAILTKQTGTMGAKLHDFADSLDMKNRRTFWLDHELGGKPFVADVWTLRDTGFLDGNLAFGANSGLRRQLTQEQLNYAASDVLHLHAIKEKLDAMLVREGREQLAKACFEFLPTRSELDLRGWSEVDPFAH